MFLPPGLYPQAQAPQINAVDSRHLAASVDEIHVVGAEIKEATDSMVEMIVGYAKTEQDISMGSLGWEELARQL